MTYIEFKSLTTLSERIVAFDTRTGEQLFDTFYATREKEAEYNHHKVISVWAGHKQRTKGIYPFASKEDVVLCMYLQHIEQ